jgi:hypothetical protein
LGAQLAGFQTDHIRQLLAAPLRLACVLLVHSDVAVLAAAGAMLAAETAWPRLNLTAALCPALLDLPPDLRGDAVLPALAEAAEAAPPHTPLLLDGIDLLAEPSLALDPLAVLRQLSRRRPLAVLWPGSLSGSVLCYAVPEHNHYRRWPDPGLCAGCIVRLPSTA